MNVPNYADILPQLPPGRWARSACFPSMAALCFGEDSQENLHERAEHFHCKWFYEHLQCACWKDGSQHWVFLLITQGSVELTKTNQSLPPYSSMLTQTSSVFRRNDLIPELTLPERSNQLWLKEDAFYLLSIPKSKNFSNTALRAWFHSGAKIWHTLKEYNGISGKI